MKAFRSSFIFLFFFIALLSAFYILSAKNEPQVIESTRFYMGTIIQIKVSLENKESSALAKTAIDKAFKEIERVENVFSVFKRNSEISRINRLKADEPLSLSDEVFAIIEKSILYNEKTKGAFDITVKPLVELWEQSKNRKALPSDGEVKEALAKVGCKYISLDRLNRRISLKKDSVKFDLGGVAKGYATDRAIKILKDSRVKNAIVNSGGDMYCLGRKSKADLWKVGIQHPRKKNALFLEIFLEDKAAVTSGDYEKYFILDGRRYSHIIDPRTGYAIGDNVLSATVIADDSTTADILATALCVLGHDGLKVVESIRGVDAIIIFNDDGNLKIETTKGLTERYEVKKK